MFGNGGQTINENKTKRRKKHKHMSKDWDVGSQNVRFWQFSKYFDILVQNGLVP